MASLAEDAAQWSPLVDDRLAHFNVPGAVAGVVRGDERVTIASGLANVEAGWPVTAGTLFQIGSVTKVFTTALVMRLVQDGRVDLDAAVGTYLPDFATADPNAGELIAVRHLLTHTSGLAGDSFEDTGRGSDSVDRYVRGLRAHPLVHPPGAYFSYCNSGFAVLAAIVHAVTGLEWEHALSELVLKPTGLSRTVSLPEDVLLWPHASGYLPGATTPPRPTPVWAYPRGGAAAGAVVTTIDDVLSFAVAHLHPDREVLTAATVRELWHEQVRPLTPAVGAWGLGWELSRGNPTIVGHAGQQPGQSAWLRLVPDAGLAVAMMTNSAEAYGVFEAFFAAVLDASGIVVTPPDREPASPVPDLGRLAGVYAQRPDQKVEIVASGDRLTARPEFTSPGFETEEWAPFELRALGGGRFAIVTEEPNEDPYVVFDVPDDGGQPEYMTFNSRLYRRT